MRIVLARIAPALVAKAPNRVLALAAPLENVLAKRVVRTAVVAKLVWPIASPGEGLIFG